MDDKQQTKPVSKDVLDKMNSLKPGDWNEMGGTAEGDAWNFEENPEFTAYYVATAENVGKNHQKLHSFKLDEDNKFVVWGSHVVDARLSTAVVGDLIRIIYLGKETSKKTGKDYHNFQVFKRSKGEI